MADAVTNKTILDGQSIIVHLTNISDGTGETNVVKIDRSTLLVDGLEVSNLALKSARWCIQGMFYVKLSWDHTADDTAMVLSGNGYEEYVGSLKDPNTSVDTVTGAIGDVLLTTNGAVSGSSYDITLEFRKNT